MKTGTIPGLPASMAGPPATIGPTPADAGNSQFDAWELAAMTIGAAASKSTPLTLDAVEYYNRIIGFPPAADHALRRCRSRELSCSSGPDPDTWAPR